MTTTRFAPDFRLLINDSPVPAQMRASISSVTYTSGLEGADRVEIALVNQQLRWLDHPLLAFDNQLTLLIGYAPNELTQVFVGNIIAHSANFPASGLPTLSVAAQDRKENLQQGSKVRWFAVPTPSIGNFPLPDMAVAGIVAVENGLIPIFEPVGAALSVLLGGIELAVAIDDSAKLQNLIRKQQAESDYDFLKRIAAQNGWEMVIEHTGPLAGRQLRFMSPLDHLAPDVILKYGQSLIEFSPRVSTVGQIISISAYVWVAELKTTFTVTVGWDWDRMSLTIDVRPEFVPLGQGPSDYLIEEPVTAASAPRILISKLIPRLNNRLTGSGSTIGDPRIRAGSVLRLDGLGVQFGGLYRVVSATHNIDSGGYRTNFDVRKEIWFGSIPMPEQGAVPIRVNAPFVS